MPEAMLVLRLALCATFVVAAVGKLADRDGTRDAAAAFGAPERAARVLVFALPVLELTAAALLLPAETALAGAALSLLLLAVFSVAIAVNLRRGLRPDCHCFGSVHSAPIGPATLIRNGLLAAAAGVVLASGADGVGPSAIAWTQDVQGASFALGLGLGLASLLAVAYVLLRRYGGALRRVALLEETLEYAGVELPGGEPQLGVALGDAVPAFDGLEAALARGRPAVLTFTSVGCGPCAQLEPRVAEWEGRGELTFIRRDFAEHRALADAFGVTATPGAVLIDPDATAGSRPVHGLDEIVDLVEGYEPPPARPGDELPDVTLEELDGAPVGLRTVASDALVVFWNPNCGFCAQMRDELAEFEDEVPLVVVASGDVDAVRADAFRVPVLLDHDRGAAIAVGANGTPMALRVAAGRIASPVVAGRDAVLELAGSYRSPVRVVHAGALTPPDGSV